MNTTVLDIPNSRTQRSVEAFKNRFGRPHFILACHAALPLSFTPELLYGLWVNFQQDCQGGMLNIPWIAASDLLLSEFCDEVGHQLYEMDRFIRNELLRHLREDPIFGARRVEAIAQFVSSYVQEQSKSDDPDMRDFAQAQQWTALAYTQSEVAAQQLALALSHAYQHDRDDLLRLALIVEALEEPLADFPQLLAYARGMAHLARGDLEAAKAEFDKMDLSNKQLDSAGVTLAIPLKTERATKPIKRTVIKFNMPRNYWVMASVLSAMAWGVSIYLNSQGALSGPIANLSVPKENEEPPEEPEDKTPLDPNNAQPEEEKEEPPAEPEDKTPLEPDNAQPSPRNGKPTREAEASADGGVTITLKRPSENGDIPEANVSQSGPEEGDSSFDLNDDLEDGEEPEQPSESGDGGSPGAELEPVSGGDDTTVADGTGGQTTPGNLPSVDESVDSEPDQSTPTDEETSPFERITSINQLVDVSPVDYYYAPLQALVELYGLQLGDSDAPERFRGNERITPNEYESWQREIFNYVNTFRSQQGLTPPWAFNDFQALLEDIAIYNFAGRIAPYDYDHIGVISGEDPVSPMGAPVRWPNGSRGVMAYHLNDVMGYLVEFSYDCSYESVICQDISNPEFVNPFGDPPLDCSRAWGDLPPGCPASAREQELDLDNIRNPLSGVELPGLPENLINDPDASSVE